jgi:hypothetical protein
VTLSACGERLKQTPGRGVSQWRPQGGCQCVLCSSSGMGHKTTFKKKNPASREISSNAAAVPEPVVT